MACVPINGTSTWESHSHKAVNQLDFEVTQPCRVVVGDVGYCISRNLIRVAMSHICYLFEGLIFSFGLEPLLLAVRGLILRCPQKVAVRRMTIGRCVANCLKYALSPRPRGRFSPVGNENRGHPTTASYLCIGKSSPERQGVAVKNIGTPCGAAYGTTERASGTMTEPPAEPLPAVSGFLSQAESSTIGSAARAEILPTGRQWLDDLGRNLSLQPADVSKALPTSAGRGLWFRPVSFQ